MSVTVTKTATATSWSERWTNFSPSFLQYMDSYLATCDLGANDSEKYGAAGQFGFAIPLDATITGMHVAAYWWGSNAGSYIRFGFPSFGQYAYDTGAVSGRWATADISSGLPTPTEANNPQSIWMQVFVGRTTGAAVSVYIDQITVSVTYEPYVAPPPPASGVPTVTTQAVSGIHSTSATGNGTVVSDMGAGIGERGVQVGRWPGGTDSAFAVGGETGAYTVPLTPLAPGTLYYVRAYAGNANGYGFGADVTFTAAPQKAGDGGAGLVSSLSGQSAGYAGGGGGGMLSYGAPGGATHGGGLGKGLGWGNGNPGVINTGGGGGGAGSTSLGNCWGGDGGKGVVVIRYKTADAIATSPSLRTSIFRPSLAYRAGRLFAPYSKGEDAKILTIAGNTLASPTIVDTTEAHGILAATAQVVSIAGSNSTPSIDGSHVATRVSDTTFSIPVNVTTAGTAGLVLYNHSVGWALTSGGYNDVGWLTQSPTTFHTGSMKKDFRYASVSHDVLPDGATVRPMSWLIDGVYGTANGVAYSPQETRYSIDQQGYSIETTLGMTPDYTKSISPVVKGVNVVWNFVKNKKHTYSLDCRSGAEAGRWNENPLAALKFLYATANERASFEDRFAGVYQGAIESVEFTPAPISPSEGPSGICKIVVREQG